MLGLGLRLQLARRAPVAELTQKEKARRYDLLVKYYKSWPYSPYYDLEYRDLSSHIRNLIKYGDGYSRD